MATGGTIFRCHFDGKPVSLRPRRYHDLRHDDICFVSYDAEVDISEVSQGAQLGTMERWGCSDVICEPTITWYQTYILYYKRLVFERLEHLEDEDCDLIYFSADEIFQRIGFLQEDTPYKFGKSILGIKRPTFDPKNQEKMSWCEEDIWHKMNKDGEWTNG